MLADFGASVVRVDRHAPAAAEVTEDVLCRNKRSVAVDLKSARGAALVHKLVQGADVLIDPFRPGVLERAGLGPEVWFGKDGGEGGGGDVLDVFGNSSQYERVSFH